ncbi:MAG: beta-propeller fold lactonase family protein [Thermomicrobiales bacterium]
MNRDASSRHSRRAILATGAALGSGLLIGSGVMAPRQTRAAQAEMFANGEGAVFVGTNHNNTSDADEPANQIVMYRRTADGHLSLIDAFATGGQGSGPSQRFAGDGLGAGNSVRLSKDNRWLFVANAGSNTVSVMEVMQDRLNLVEVAPTGDGSRNRRFPNSVTQFGDLVYVLNSADEGSITGFRLAEDGHLTPLAGSTRTLNANQTRFTPDPLANPTQIEFTPDGAKLIVTIKDGPAAGFVPGFTPSGPGRVLVFAVDANGLPDAEFVQSNFDNRGPFGFSFDTNGNLLVAEFIGGGIEQVNGADALVGAAGSYTINDDGSLTAISAAVPNHQLDTCWLVNNGTYAYGANYSSGTVSSYTIGADGSLTLLEAVAGGTEDPENVQGSTPLDARISQDGRYLYVVLPGSGRVAGWQIMDDGALNKLGEYAGLPQTVDGDHASFDFSALGSPAGIEAI